MLQLLLCFINQDDQIHKKSSFIKQYFIWPTVENVKIFIKVKKVGIGIMNF